MFSHMLPSQDFFEPVVNWKNKVRFLPFQVVGGTALHSQLADKRSDNTSEQMQLYQVFCFISKVCVPAQKYKLVLLACKKAEKPSTKGASFWKRPRGHLTIGKSVPLILMCSAYKRSTDCYNLYLRSTRHCMFTFILLIHLKSYF